MGYRTTLEKLIKSILIFMILALGFIMRCELFHTTLSDSVFASYPALSCNIKESEFDSFMKDLKQDATKTGTSYFFVTWDNKSRLEHQLTLFAENETVINSLNEKNPIEPGTYTSFLNGWTKIVFSSLDNLTYHDLMNNPYLCVTGSDEQNNSLYEKLSETYEVGYPQITQANESDMIIIIWIMIVIFIILINGSLILRKKKEMLIRTVYGEDIIFCTIKSMIEDFILFEALYLIAKLFVSQFVTGDYMPTLAFWVFQVGCLIAVSLNLLYLKSDVRAVFSNTTNQKGFLAFLYALKFAAFFIAVFTLTTNVGTLQKSLLSNGAAKIYTNYQKDVFLSINDEARTLNLSERNTLQKGIWEKFYGEYYDTVHPVISVKLTDHPSILLVNEFAASLLPETIDVSSLNEDGITILYPKNWYDSLEDIPMLMNLYLKNPEHMIWEEKSYSEKLKVPYVAMNQVSGFSEALNPLIVYCGKNVPFNSTVFENSQDVIYHISEEDIASVDELLHITEQNFKIEKTNVGELYEYQMNFVQQMIRFLSSLCVLIIILEMAITITLANMEYRLFGMEYALKKVSGYSFLMRNQKLFARTNMINMVFVLLLMALGFLTGIYSAVTALFIGLLMMLVENMVLLLNILKLERQSVKKILKGGCL